MTRIIAGIQPSDAVSSPAVREQHRRVEQLAKEAPFRVGDRVRYTRMFLDQFAGSAGDRFQRLESEGTVTELSGTLVIVDEAAPGMKPDGYAIPILNVSLVARAGEFVAPSREEAA